MSEFVIISDSAFPFKISAANQKYYLLSKALQSAQYNINFLNKYNIYYELEEASGISNDINYEFLSGKNKLNSSLKKFVGVIKSNVRLAQRLKSISKKTNKKKYILFSYSSSLMLLWLKLLSSLFGYKLVLNVWEHHQSVIASFLKSIDATIFYKTAYRLVEGEIAITSYLKNEALAENSNLPVITIPAIADFDLNERLTETVIYPQKEYFLYCGGVGYIEVIELIIEAFKNISKSDIQLILVLNGKAEEIDKCKIKHLNDQIAVKSDLDYADLLSLYKNAKALLIPLRSTIQDVARFPQKMPDYLSSGRPVITNRVGDIKRYFTNKENIVFADNFDSYSIAVAMDFIIDNPKVADKIGLAGKAVGKKHFDYSNIINELDDFLNSL